MITCCLFTFRCICCDHVWFVYSYNLLTRYEADGVTPVLEILGYYEPCTGTQDCRQLALVTVMAGDAYVMVNAEDALAIG